MARADAHVTLEIGPAEAVADLLAGLHEVIDGDARDGQTVRDSVIRLLEAFAASKPEIRRRPEAPRTWSLPPEPGPEVTAVRDQFKDRFVRVDDGWQMAGHETCCSAYVKRWEDLRFPLTDATEVTS